MPSMDRAVSPRAHLRVAARHGVAAVTGPELFADEPEEPMSVMELLDAETRLLARAVGGHLPLELALQVDELRARRAALGRRP